MLSIKSRQHSNGTIVSQIATRVGNVTVEQQCSRTGIMPNQLMITDSSSYRLYNAFRPSKTRVHPYGRNPSFVSALTCHDRVVSRKIPNTILHIVVDNKGKVSQRASVAESFEERKSSQRVSVTVGFEERKRFLKESGCVTDGSQEGAQQLIKFMCTIIAATPILFISS